MIKKTTFIILVIILCTLFVARERNNIAETPKPTVSQATIVTKKLTIPIEEFYSIINNEDGTYTVKLFYTTYFYDTKANLISQAYDTPVLIDKGKIVLIQNKKLIVSDIFDKSIYFKEVERNFSETVPPSSAIISAKFIKSNELQINYYEGKDFTEKSEIIDLSKL